MKKRIVPNWWGIWNVFGGAGVFALLGIGIPDVIIKLNNLPEDSLYAKWASIAIACVLHWYFTKDTQILKTTTRRRKDFLKYLFKSNGRT